MSNNDVSPHALATPKVSIADGGIETALEERIGMELREFAAFALLDTDEGKAALEEYYRPFIQLAVNEGIPLVLDTPTWRANPDWGRLLGYDVAGLDRANEAAARLVRETSEKLAPGLDLTVSGCIGPRYDDEADEQGLGPVTESEAVDGVAAPNHASVETSSDSGSSTATTRATTDAASGMTPAEAAAYHAPQLRALAAGGADRVGAVTMSDAAEATGIVRAAREIEIPVTVSFAVGADGRLASGATLAGAILEVEEATDSYPLGYLVNCAHPSEVARALSGRELNEAEARLLSSRVIGFRLNSARHGEEGPGDNPAAFAQAVLELRPLAPSARIFGGCCGTDAQHIAAIVEGLASASHT